jgi:heme-degrading monooxygenase HmoA
MYARVSQYEGGAPEGLEESVRRGREEILPAARELDGFAGAIALLDRRTGRHMVISLWESEEAMSASEEVAEELRERQLTGGEQVASVSRYEVAMLELESAAQAQ